jgi:hypothetical protein
LSKFFPNFSLLERCCVHEWRKKQERISLEARGFAVYACGLFPFRLALQTLQFLFYSSTQNMEKHSNKALSRPNGYRKLLQNTKLPKPNSENPDSLQPILFSPSQYTKQGRQLIGIDL